MFGELRWSYEELHRRVGTLAAQLRRRGFRAGDCLATLSTPRPEFLLLLLATGRLGGIWMGLNPRYRPPELEWLIADARPKVLTVLSTLDADLRRSARARRVSFRAALCSSSAPTIAMRIS